MENYQGEGFLHQRDSKLHTSEPVEKTQERKKTRQEETSSKPAEKIAAYLDRLKVLMSPEPLKDHPDFGRKERNVNLLKEKLYKSVIIRPEDIPESYFDNQRRLAREQGHGDLEITDEIRSQSAEILIADQKSTLDNWINYFTSLDSDSYPMWAKYWAFQGMLKTDEIDI